MLRKAGPYLALFALALAVRAPHLARPRSCLALCDRTENERAAASLAHGGALGNVFAEDSGASAHLSPLYPWLLGQVYRVAPEIGIHPRRAQTTLITLCTCAGICLLPLLARRAGLQPGAGWLAALLLAVVPGNRHFETSGCHEQPLLCVGLTALLLAFVGLHEDGWRSPWRIAVTAALIGACALLGPMLLTAAALMVLADVMLPRGDRRAVLAGAVVFVVTCAVTLFPWAYRNHRVLGGWVWTRSNFGLELWIGNNPDATGKTYFTGFHIEHPFCSTREAREYSRVGELQYMRGKKEAAREWIAAHPAAFSWLTVQRVRWFWFPTESMVWWDGKTWVAYLYCTSTVGMLAGLLGLFRAGHPHRWLFLAAIVGFSLPYLLTHVDVRYRYPLCGLCTLLSCDFAVRAFFWMRRGVTSSPPR
jgi:hypothetical protein